MEGLGPRLITSDIISEVDCMLDSGDGNSHAKSHALSLALTLPHFTTKQTLHQISCSSTCISTHKMEYSHLILLCNTLTVQIVLLHTVNKSAANSLILLVIIH